MPTADGRVVALRVDTGEPVWERRLGGAPNDILALDDRLYVGSNDNFFYCLKADDGRVDWRWRTGGDVIGLPVADDARLLRLARQRAARAEPGHAASSSGSGRCRSGRRGAPSRPVDACRRRQTPPLRAYNVKDGVAAGTLTGVAASPQETTPPRAADWPPRR